MDTVAEGDYQPTWRRSCIDMIVNFVANKVFFFIIPILHVLDYVSDLTVLARFWECGETKNLGYISLSIIVCHRVTTALILGDQDGWRSGLRQLFDLEMVIVAYDSVKYKRTVFGLRKHKVLDGILENLPQLLLQTYYLIEYGNPSCAEEKSWVLYFSIALSLLSLSRCYVYSDMVSISQRGLSCRYQCKIFTRVPPKLSNGLSFMILHCWRFGEIT